MLSIKGRILISYALFGILLLLLAIFAYRFLNQSADIRKLQVEVLSVNNKALLLVDTDEALRTEDILNSSFFKDSSYARITHRKELNDGLYSDLERVQQKISKSEIIDVEKLKNVRSVLDKYNRKYDQLMVRIQERGFKDDGLEGSMRSYAHELEKYPGSIALDQVLLLRRHEKDYFMRSDTSYVRKFNKLSENLISSLKNDSGGEVLLVVDLIRKYQKEFLKIVDLETEIGSLNAGLLKELNVEEKSLITNISALSSEISLRINEKENKIIKQSILFILIGLLFASLIGYWSAHIVSRSIKNLAVSMRQTIRSSFESKISKPSKWVANETKSLYESYEKLIDKIKSQLNELEEANEKLGERNDSLNELINRIKESEECLKVSNELKDKFFSIIAHDLKGPISSHTQLLEYLVHESESMPPESIKAIIRQLFDSSSSISILLENLLNWARNQNSNLTPKKSEFLIGEMIDNIQKLNVQRIEQKNIGFINNISPNLSVNADKDMMDLVMRNLIDNAIKYTPANGQVWIENEVKEDKVIISVRDTGLGIKKDEKDRLFTTMIKKRTQGTNGEPGIGLGLMLAFDFVRKNGGVLDVDSEPGSGSTFTVVLNNN